MGPLVISIVAVRKGREKKLSHIGVRDSKMLTPKKRAYLYDEILSMAEDVKVYSITAEEINRAMRSNISINELEAIHFARIMDSLPDGVSKIFIDSPDVVAERFGRRISIISNRPVRIGSSRKGSGIGIRVVAEHKADATYAVTSAASIIAKVTRDREIEGIREDTGIDFGSGYPSDSKTLRALKTDLKKKALRPYLREMWRTMENIKQSRMTEFLDT